MKKILLDECIPRKFKNLLPGLECVTVPEAGWDGEKNGELLSMAEKAGYEVFVTLDRGIEYEQNLTRRRIAVVLLQVRSNRLADLAVLAPDVLRALEFIQAGQLLRLP